MVKQKYVKRAISILGKSLKEPKVSRKRIEEAHLILAEAMAEDWCRDCK